MPNGCNLEGTLNVCHVYLGCHDNLVKKIGSEDKLGEVYDEFGSNIYSQMMKMKVRDDADSRDIFAEQALICATLGVVDCFRMDKLRKALRWVSRTGCIYDPKQPKIEKRVEAFIGKLKKITIQMIFFKS